MNEESRPARRLPDQHTTPNVSGRAEGGSRIASALGEGMSPDLSGGGR